MSCSRQQYFPINLRPSSSSGMKFCLREFSQALFAVGSLGWRAYLKFGFDFGRLFCVYEFSLISTKTFWQWESSPYSVSVPKAKLMFRYMTRHWSVSYISFLGIGHFVVAIQSWINWIIPNTNTRLVWEESPGACTPILCCVLSTSWKKCNTRIFIGCWRWCTTHRSNGFLGFVHRPDSKELEDKNTTFRKMDLFPSSGEERHLLCWVP
jgi:hypothetical protein